MKVSKETAAMVARLGLDPEEVIYNPDGSVTTMQAQRHYPVGEVAFLNGGFQMIDNLAAELKRQKAQRAKDQQSSKS